MVVLELLPYVIGQYEIHFPTSETSAGNGSRAATVVVAHLDVTDREGTCAFQFGKSNPCNAAVCKTPEPTEECMQFVAEYCYEFPLDTGCSLVSPLFVRRAAAIE